MLKLILDICMTLYFASFFVMCVQILIIAYKRYFNLTSGKRPSYKLLDYLISIAPNEEAKRKVIMLKKTYTVNLVFLVLFVASFAAYIISENLK